MANKPSAIIFAVNGTLIDMNPLGQRVNELWADTKVKRQQKFIWMVLRTVLDEASKAIL